MQLAVVTDINDGPVAKEYVLVKPAIEIITMRLMAQNFYSMGGGFNYSFATTVKNNVKTYYKRGKKIAIEIFFGDYCGNYILGKYPYLEFIESRHQGTGPKTLLEIPIFWNKDFIAELKNFFSSLYNSLKEVLPFVDHFKITGFNERTGEWRGPDQDFRPTGDPYENAAKKYLAAGYTHEIMFASTKDFFDFLFNLFNGFPLCLMVIGGKTGFPALDKDNKYTPQLAQRYDMTSETIKYAVDHYPGVMIQSNALTATGGTPSNVMNSGGKICFQITDVPEPTDIQAVITHAMANYCNKLEVFNKTVLAFPDIHV